MSRHLEAIEKGLLVLGRTTGWTRTEAAALPLSALQRHLQWVSPSHG